MQQRTKERVSFNLRRTACAQYPITTIQDATKQVHAERIVCELSDSARPEAIGFNYHIEVMGHQTEAVKTDVVLTISGSDELLVRKVAQRLDEHYHGQPFYETEVDSACKSWI